MTPDRAHDRDDREDIECLAHRAQIILPDTLLPDGTASRDQYAVVPPGVSLAKAFLPHREIDGPPSSWTGAAIVGTREPDIAPYIVGFGNIPFGDGGRSNITRPRHRDAILRWLYDMTGYRYAPAAFFKVAGWEIGWAANFLDRLFSGGLIAELIVAERQAAAAVRAMWIFHDQSQGSATLLNDSGAVLAARALIDMVAAFSRHVSDTLGASCSTTAVHRRQETAAMTLVVRRLQSCVAAIVAAHRTPGRFAAHAKLGAAIDHARKLVDAVGLFTVASEGVGDRTVRVIEALSRKGSTMPHTSLSIHTRLDAIAAELEGLSVASDQDRLNHTTWCRVMTAGLERLENPDRAQRLTALAIVRTDLVYKLIVTRRLDRLFGVLPWMAAPSGAFPLTFGGPLGAVGALFEAGRSREVALELKCRLFAHSGGLRLDTRRGRREYADPAKVKFALKMQTRAGFLLASSALSHAMVQAYLAGSHFGPAHPLPTLCAGRIDWQFETSMQGSKTLKTVITAELAKHIYATSDYDRDLARYMGMPIADVLAAQLIDIFPGDHRDPGFGKFMQSAGAARHRLKQTPIPASVSHAGNANRELLRSVLKSLDAPTDGIDADWRSNGVVAKAIGDVELAKFDKRHGGRTGFRAVDGGAVRRRASTIRKRQGSPGRALRSAIDKARTWRSAKNGILSDDQPLAAILSGQSTLPGLVPCAQLFAQVVWFAPSIDSHIHDWIADGAPLWAPIALGNVVHAGLIAREVQAVGVAMPALFGMPIPPSLRRRILVPLWTGLAGITADHAHVR